MKVFPYIPIDKYFFISVNLRLILSHLTGIKIYYS